MNKRQRKKHFKKQLETKYSIYSDRFILCANPSDGTLKMIDAFATKKGRPPKFIVLSPGLSHGKTTLFKSVYSRLRGADVSL